MWIDLERPVPIGEKADGTKEAEEATTSAELNWATFNNASSANEKLHWQHRPNL